MRRIADQKFDGELKVRDLLEIALEHRAIAGEAERPAVVSRVFGDEPMRISASPAGSGEIASVEVGEGGFVMSVPSAVQKGRPTSLCAVARLHRYYCRS
jgi:hypothetical protein